MMVRDLVTGRVVTAMRGASLREAAHLMWDHGVDSLLVIEQRRLRGIVTEGDLLRCIAGDGEPDMATVGTCMTPNPVVVSPDAEDRDAARQMLGLHLRHLPVVDHGKVLGVLSMSDLLRADIRAPTGGGG